MTLIKNFLKKREIDDVGREIERGKERDGGSEGERERERDKEEKRNSFWEKTSEY